METGGIQTLMKVLNLGKLDYQAAWQVQLETWEAVHSGDEDTLILVEHDPVLTLGVATHNENLLLTEAAYRERGIAIHQTDRGGDVTYHGPGQLVAYPIFDLSRKGKDLHAWLRALEQIGIDFLEEFGIAGRRFPPNTGVWIGDEKVLAIGIKVRKWVSLHGIALNCNNPLDVYELFVPCGIRGYGVTSMSRLLDRDFLPEDGIQLVTKLFLKLSENPLCI